MTDSKLRILNRDALKYLALMLMTLGHFAPLYAEYLPAPVMRSVYAVMYAAPPIFFFFIAEGYHYTKSKNNMHCGCSCSH